MKLKVFDIEAWLLVAFGFLALGLAYSARALLSFTMPAWEQDLDWSRSFVSAVAAVALLVTACLAPIGGRFVDLYGSRNTLFVGLVALAIGSFAIAWSSNPVFFAIAFAGVSAIGFGLVATHVVSTGIEQRIDRNRGLASGVATSGSSAGQFLIVPLLAILMTATSWRWSYAAMGLLCLVAIAGILYALPAEGGARRKPVSARSISTKLAEDIQYVLSKPAFHILFWSYLICGYTTTGVVETHLLPYAAFCGFAPVPSATAYGLLSAINLAGMIGAGWLTDKMNRPLLLASIYIVRGLSFIILANIGADLPTLLLFAGLFGLVDYSTVPVTASLIASHIGLRVMGLAFGIITAGHQVGAAIGAYLGGYLFDLSARYDWIWWSSVWLALGAGGLVLMMSDGRSSHQAA